ncbi:MAG: 30S ribosomal protein S7 [Fidelibacterota bacterium]
MPRRRRPAKRKILPDPVYHEDLVAKFINGIMRKGKKSLAEQIFYTAIEKIEAQTKKNGLEIFHKAIENVKPVLEVKSRRIGGATYQVPIEVNHERRKTLAIRWLVTFAKQRSGKTMADRLAAELISASKGEGGAVKKREDTHRMAEANKAFAHFRY